MSIVSPDVAGFMQNHHAAREVFLTEMVDNNGVESLWRPAEVCLPDACEKALGDDVFICEYEYDTVWQVRFAPLVLSGPVLAGLAFQSYSAKTCNIETME